MAVIIPVDQLEPAFTNAMQALFDYYKVDSPTIGSAIKRWHEHYDCYLFHDAFYSWESVGFKNEQQMSWFILKWS